MKLSVAVGDSQPGRPAAHMLICCFWLQISVGRVVLEGNQACREAGAAMPGVPGLFLRSEALMTQEYMPSLTSRADTALLPASLGCIPDDTAPIQLSRAQNVGTFALRGAIDLSYQPATLAG